MNRINSCVSFLLLAWIIPSFCLAVDAPSENIQATTIEAVTVDGNLVVSVKTPGLTIIARSLTIEGIGGPLTVTTSPQGIEMKHDNMSMTGGGKIELRTQLTITKMDLIRIDIVAPENASRTKR